MCDSGKLITGWYGYHLDIKKTHLLGDWQVEGHKMLGISKSSKKGAPKEHVYLHMLLLTNKTR